MAGAKVPLTFRIFKGEQLVREERLSLSVIKLGKVPSAHLKLDDETVSRMHAIIEVNGPGDVSIIDLGSTKGTFVNGQKVNKAKLQSGDTIVVGETRIELAIAAGDEDEPARATPAPAAEVISSTPRPVPPAPVAAPPPPPAAPPTPRIPVPPVTPPSPLATPPVVPPPPIGAAPAFTPPQTFVPPVPQSFAAAAVPPSPPVASALAPTVRPPPGLPAPVFGAPIAPSAGFQQAIAESIDDYGGARAIEVAAMLGDSVVRVKHCIDPQSGKVTAPTWALLAIGVFTLLISIYSFKVGFDNADYNKGGLDAWILGDPERGIQPKPVHAFRPVFLSQGYDWSAFGGLLLSLVTLTLGYARFTRERESPMFRIGTAPDVEFATEGAPQPSFPLIAPRGNDFALNFAHGMDGEMVLGGQTTTLAEMAAQGRTTVSPIPPNAKFRIRTGRTTFLISAVAQPRRYAAPLFAVDSLFMAVLGSTAGAFGLLWLLIRLIAPSSSLINVEYASLEDTTTRTSSTAQDDPLPPPEEDKASDGADKSGGTGTAMQLPEGTMGKRDSDRTTGQYKMEKTQDDPVLAREQALEQARNAGFLGSEALNKGGAFASLTGTGDVSSGFDDSNIYGGLLGNEAGEMQGGFGFGRSGFGAGGGGTGWGTIGTGRYGTIGHGAGAGQGYGVGGGRGGMRGRTAAVPSVSIGQPTSAGDLDKAIIRRYINRNLHKIQYCYEKQLLAKPTLAGTVQTQFFITPAGIVASSTGSGVDPEVAGCVADVIKNIEFPKPKGGGSVQVNYPFIFRSSGAS